MVENSMKCYFSVLFFSSLLVATLGGRSARPVECTLPADLSPGGPQRILLGAVPEEVIKGIIEKKPGVSKEDLICAIKKPLDGVNTLHDYKYEVQFLLPDKSKRECVAHAAIIVQRLSLDIVCK